MKKILIIVDMQNDFVTGTLGTPEAQTIIPAVINKINNHKGPIIFTQDTHSDNYLTTLEGKNLPIPHCIEGTPGHDIIPEIKTKSGYEKHSILKSTFGVDWHNVIESSVMRNTLEETDEIIIIGVCTDICVVSNAIILRAMYPNKQITVDASCCAGVTPEKHTAAIETMKSCQINIIGEE